MLSSESMGKYLKIFCHLSAKNRNGITVGMHSLQEREALCNALLDIFLSRDVETGLPYEQLYV